MKIGLLDEVKNKHSIDSEKKSCKPHEVIPDEINRETCLKCPLNKCKSNCGLLK